MKKILLTLIIGIGLLSTTGCTKHSYTMSIDKNDKLIIAESQLFNTEVLDKFGKDYTAAIDAKVLEYNNLKSFKEKGFKAEKISDGKYVGIKVKKKFNSLKRINTVQLPKELSYSRVLKAKDEYVIEIKNGLFKRNYKLNFLFNTNAITASNKELQQKYVSDIKKEIGATQNLDSASENADSEEWMLNGESDIRSGADVDTDSEVLEATNQQEESIETIESINDLNHLLSLIDEGKVFNNSAVFSVRLPVNAQEHNATNVIEGNIYEWDLSKGDNVEILLTWERVHITNIIVFGFFGIILLIIYGLLHSKRHLQMKQEHEKKIQKIASSTIILRGIHKGAKGYKRKK